MDREIYNLEPKDREAIGPWVREWNARLVSCEAAGETERRAMREAARNMYETAGLTPPSKVLFAASPFAAEVGARIAAGLLHHAAAWAGEPDSAAVLGILDFDPGTIPVHPRAGRVLDGIRAVAAAAAEPVLAGETRPHIRRMRERALEIAVRVVGQGLARETQWDRPGEDPFQLSPPRPRRRRSRGPSQALARALDDADRSLVAGAVADGAAIVIRTAGIEQSGEATHAATNWRTLLYARDAVDGHPGFWPSDTVLRVTLTSRNWAFVAVSRELENQPYVPYLARFLVHCVAFADHDDPARDALWAPPPRWVSFFQHVVKLDRLAYRLVWRYHEDAELNGRLVVARKKFAVATDRPEHLGLDELERAHNASGPSLRWRDGYELHHLHGVRVPAWLGEPAAEDLDPRLYLELRNADVQREFIRKVGIERVASALGATPIDRRGGYELVAVNLGRHAGVWPYLRMINPSTGDVHLEPVARECMNVEQALEFRNGGPFEHLAPLT